MLKSRFNIAHEYKEREFEHAVEKEIVDKPKEGHRSLNKSEVSIRLSFLGKTADGDGYTYLKADLTGMGLTDINAIKCFKHLQFLNVSMNNLSVNELQAISELPYLVLIHADKNQLTSAALHTMTYLQVMILNYNDITTVQDVYQPELRTLEVGFNKIEAINFNRTMPNLSCMDFRNNQISDIGGMDFPKLDSLYLANNNITSLVGIEKLVNLRILHVRNNPIQLLNGFHECLTKIVYINLRDCRVVSLNQINKLRVLKGLQTLILKGCPYMGGKEYADSPNYEDDPETRVEILAVLPNLKRINKYIVTDEERNDAKDVVLEWPEDQDEIDKELDDQFI